MTTIYPVYTPYGNYQDGYYVSNYQDFIENLLANESVKGQKVNLGITDGITIINTLHGDFTGYNCCIVELENGDRDLYKITNKTHLTKDVWNITMVLDAFSKYYVETVSSDILVKRLSYKDRTTFNPLLFGQENIELSQVKVNQIPLNFLGEYFENEVVEEWGNLGIIPKGYIMFIQSDALDSDNMTASLNKDDSITTDYEVAGIQNFVLYNKALHKDTYVSFKYGDKTKCYYWYWWGTVYHGCYAFSRDADGIHREEWQDGYWTPGKTGTKSNWKGYAVWEDTGNFDHRDNKPDIDPGYLVSVLTDYANRQLDELDYDTYKSYENKTVLDTDTGIIYKISFGTETTSTKQMQVQDQDTLNQAFQAQALDYEGYGIGIQVEYSRIQVSIVSTGAIKENYSITLTNKLRKTTDEGFYVLWIPNFTGIPTKSRYSGGSLQQYYYDFSIIKKFIDKFRETYGGENGKILDIQETYFIPPGLTISGNLTGITTPSSLLGEDEEVEGRDSTNHIIYWWCYALESCSGIITSNQSLTVSDYKLEQQNRYMIKSPSGASTFEFSLAKNAGVSGYNLKYNLRPYASMYQVQPIFKGYYGQNYTDTRGLVMLEDTSITQRTDLYETYKRQNVNYINSFNSNQTYERNQLELKQGAERRNYRYDVMRNTIETGSEAGQSAIGYNALGNAYGFNGAGMGALSAAGIVLGETADQLINWQQFMRNQRTERQQLSMSQAETRKQWEYSLGNIEALPTNTDKVSGIYNTNYGAFYIEVYNPTDYEITVYTQYLDLFGISIGFPLDLITYDFDYIEGNIIKFSTALTAEEYDEINIELNSGRRLYNGSETSD